MQRFCLYLEVIGLRNPKLRKRVMEKTNLTWAALKTSFNTLTKANKSDHKLSEAIFTADVAVKQEHWEVTVVYKRRNQGRFSKRSYICNCRGYEARSP